MKDETMLPCDHVIAILWEYIDGELDPGGSERVESHLDVCARCYPEYDFRRAYRTYLRRASSQSVPSEVRRRIFMAILEDERPGDQPAEPAGTFSRLRALLSRRLPRRRD